MKKELDKATVAGVDIHQRMHLFDCHVCGTCEDESFREGRVILLPDGMCVPEDGQFIVLNQKETSRNLKNGMIRFRTRYTYICGLCGVHQEACFTEDFER